MSLYAIGHSIAARRWIGALAVLVLALRALVPAGFMLAQVDGRLSVVVCPAAAATLAVATASDGASMPGMHDGAGALSTPLHTGAHAAHHLAVAASCPFVLSGGAMFASRALRTPDPYLIALRPARAPAVVSFPAAPPPRYRSPRGPPTLL